MHEHLDVCEACRISIAEQSGLAGMEADIHYSLQRKEPARRSFWESRRPYRYAAAALFLVAAGITFWSTHPTPVPANPAVTEALSTGKIPLPAFLPELAGRREVLMGGTRNSGSEVMSPSGTVLLDSRPSFTWTALPGKWGYNVHVYGPDGNVFTESGAIETTTWICRRDLSPGTTFQWQVTAIRGDERRTLPSPPDVPPRFRIADAATSEHLWRLRGTNTSHLELAVEYGRAGLLAETRREMEAAVAKSPNDPRLRRLLDSVPAIGGQAATR